jgi:hypothetical protein
MASVQSYIYLRSQQLGLDPSAVLAVVSTEGGFNPAPGVYDPDTRGAPGWSYGPFQLRSPGALPISSAGATGPGATFAWSKQGIDYALGQIATVAKGKRGTEAIYAIVNGFEHPANVPGEVAKAASRYGSFQPIGAHPAKTGVIPFTGAPSIVRAVGGVAATQEAPGGLLSGLESAVNPLDFVKRLADPNLWLRIGQVVGGAILAFAGIVLLVRQIGLAPPSVPNPVTRVAEAVA